MAKETVYRCSRKCPLGKRCFILKVREPIDHPMEVLQKCSAEKGKDITILIGGEKPP